MSFEEIVKGQYHNQVFPIKSWCAVSRMNPRVFKQHERSANAFDQYDYSAVIRQQVYDDLNERGFNYAPYQSSIRGRQNLWRYFYVEGTVYTIFAFSQPDLGMIFKLRWS